MYIWVPPLLAGGSLAVGWRPESWLWAASGGGSWRAVVVLEPVALPSQTAVCARGTVTGLFHTVSVLKSLLSEGEGLRYTLES